MAGLILLALGFMGAGAATWLSSNTADSNVSAVAADPLPAAPAPAVLSAAEEAFYRDVARDAWAYMETNYVPATGLVKATPDWAYTTVWDVGGQLLAFLSAREMGLLAEEEYHRRTARLLQTLEDMRLFRDAAYNKLYSAADGSMGDAQHSNGTGWSATDLGRLLVGLKVLSVREPRYAAQAERIVRRIDMKQVVKDGYVHGQLIGSTTGRPWTFQEGRIGYEQYVARGFDAWGAKVGNALSVRIHAQPIQIMGVDILADRRKLDRLLSEPFILLGIELGLPQDMQQLAANVLRVQEARFQKTGQITMVSEDAVAVRPSYFYYYCVYCNGKEFVIDISSPGNERNEPRWVSTKAAFGWHALMPNEYTEKALQHVSGAHDSRRGWASGVFEGSGKSTETFDINTAAVLLEIAAFQLRGKRPLIHTN
ncbi:MAG TPA: DUF3131 domain-containing protein [Longimicrobiales bacterium]|nr:DUF3131 domain-containing protein [Longimicrobiales bacterium]